MPAPLSTRILHAGLTIRDEAAATRFYKDVLGFGEIWRGGRSEGVTDWVNMRVPDGTDYLEYMLVTSPPDRRQRGVLHHVALLVPDIQAAWEAAGARTPAGERQAGPTERGPQRPLAAEPLRYRRHADRADGTVHGSLSLGVGARVDRPEEERQAAPGHSESPRAAETAKAASRTIRFMAASSRSIGAIHGSNRDAREISRMASTSGGRIAWQCPRW